MKNIQELIAQWLTVRRKGWLQISERIGSDSGDLGKSPQISPHASDLCPL